MQSHKKCRTLLKLTQRAWLVDKRHGVFKILKPIVYDMTVDGEPLDDGQETIGERRGRRGQGSTSKGHIIRVHMILQQKCCLKCFPMRSEFLLNKNKLWFCVDTGKKQSSLLLVPGLFMQAGTVCREHEPYA